MTDLRTFFLDRIIEIEKTISRLNRDLEAHVLDPYGISSITLIKDSLTLTQRSLEVNRDLLFVLNPRHLIQEDIQKKIQ